MDGDSTSVTQESLSVIHGIWILMESGTGSMQRALWFQILGTSIRATGITLEKMEPW